MEPSCTIHTRIRVDNHIFLHSGRVGILGDTSSERDKLDAFWQFTQHVKKEHTMKVDCKYSSELCKLTTMGFDEEDAARALNETGGDVGTATDLIMFNYMLSAGS